VWSVQRWISFDREANDLVGLRRTDAWFNTLGKRRLAAPQMPTQLRAELDKVRHAPMARCSESAHVRLSQ
jgi:hypothetical protein